MKYTKPFLVMKLFLSITKKKKKLIKNLIETFCLFENFYYEPTNWTKIYLQIVSNIYH